VSFVKIYLKKRVREIVLEVSKILLMNLKDVEKVIKNYTLYYNNNRFQWNKKKMTPVQYRNHLQKL